MDAQEQVVGSAVWGPAPRGISAYRFNAEYREYFNIEGEKLGCYEDYGLKLDYQLPEPLRTLIIASPLAFDIMD
ncbi:MAG: hypothetical protein IRY90_19345, partial [Actinomadura rubrobrunea]|nr:hypothetical protein [Actinomadura rubrobrunea]